MNHIKKINEFVNDINYDIIIDNLKEETLIISSSSEIKENNNYKKLLSMGIEIIPKLVESMKNDNNISICMLISDVSKIKIPDGISGNLDKIKDFYLNEFYK